MRFARLCLAGAVLLATVAAGVAEDGAEPSTGAAAEARLSPECTVPGSRLYKPAPLRSIKRALRDRRVVRVLAIGSSSTEGVGASSPSATYPVRLEGELERLFPGVDIDVYNRGVSGEVAAGAAERMGKAVAEVRPDLVVWQVGTNDAERGVDLDAFTQALDETVRWLKAQRVDVVLVDPQFTATPERDGGYGRVAAAIQAVAQHLRVAVVSRYEAMRSLAGARPVAAYLARDHFHLNDLGYRCMAEYIARGITVSLLLPDPPTTAAAGTGGIEARAQ